MIVTLKTFTPNPLQVIEEAACECYQSTPTPIASTSQSYFSGHHSVLNMFLLPSRLLVYRGRVLLSLPAIVSCLFRLKANGM